MANEITLNPYEQAEGEFSAEELDSLQVGEQLAEQEQQLLAGKYKSAEELERGYLELQKRLSGKEDPEVETQEEEPEQEEASDEEGLDLYGTIMESYRTGEWDPEVVNKVEGMNPVDVANMFLEKGGATQTPQATSDDIAQIQESVGGDTEYQNMIQWASQNLSEQEVAMYDAVRSTVLSLCSKFLNRKLQFIHITCQCFNKLGNWSFNHHRHHCIKFTFKE